MTPLLALASAVAVVAALRGTWSPCGLSMLSSLNPIGEASRGNRYWLTAVWYVTGAAVGGALLGGGCALAAGALRSAHAPGTWLEISALTGAVVALASDSPAVPFALPVHPRQVDERWLTTYRRWIYAGGFGLQIGAGFATYIMSAAVYLTALLAIMTGSPGEAALVGVAFGVVRGLCVLVTAHVRSPEQLRALVARVDRSADWSMQCVRLVEATAVAVLAALVAGPVAGLAAGAVAAATLLLPLVRRRVRTLG